MGTLPNTSAERIINCLKNGIVRDYAFAWLARTFAKTTGKPIALTPEVNTLVGEIVNLLVFFYINTDYHDRTRENVFGLS